MRKAEFCLGQCMGSHNLYIFSYSHHCLFLSLRSFVTGQEQFCWSAPLGKSLTAEGSREDQQEKMGRKLLTGILLWKKAKKLGKRFFLGPSESRLQVWIQHVKIY